MRGVKFGNYHTWDDWGLLLSSYPVIEPPTPQSKTISVPGRDGQINLTKALDGYIHYNSRKVTVKLLCKAPRDQWPEKYSQMLNAIQGQELQVVFDDIPDCFLLGTFQLEKPTYKNKYCIFTISGVCDPYMYEINTADADWLWDAFNFEESVIRDYSAITVDGMTPFALIGSKRPSRPRFYATGNISVNYNSVTYQLTDGEGVTIPQIYLGEGTHTLVFYGSGTVKIVYRGGRL